MPSGRGLRTFDVKSSGRRPVSSGATRTESEPELREQRLLANQEGTGLDELLDLQSPLIATGW